MRRHHWSAPVLTALAVLASGRGALAQSDPFADDEPGFFRQTAAALPREPFPFDADQPVGDPPLEAPRFDPGIGGYPPPAYNSPVNPMAGPPGAHPWPGISPFTEHQFNQHSNEGGLWFDRWNDRGNEFDFGAAFLAARVRGPNDRPVGTQFGTLLLNIQSDAFAPFKMGSGFPNQPRTEGLEVWWGMTRPDDSGIRVGGWWLSDVKSTYSRGTGFGDITNPQYLFDTNAIYWANLQDGTADQQPYDRLYKLTYTTEAASGTLDFLMTPWRKTNWYSIQPLVAMRYMYLREKFFFLGSDSNLTYIITPGGQPDPASVNANPNGIPQIDASFQSRVDTHLAGPEAGLRYEVGGNFLRLWGRTKVGLLGNFARLNLQGENLGEFFDVDFRQFDTRFNQRDYTTRVSPSFEQSFYAESKLFRYVPYLNRTTLFREADFRLGYSFLYVGEVTRPEDNIIYRGFPNYPELKPSYSNWHTSNFSFAINWNY